MLIWVAGKLLNPPHQAVSPRAGLVVLFSCPRWQPYQLAHLSANRPKELWCWRLDLGVRPESSAKSSQLRVVSTGLHQQIVDRGHHAPELRPAILQGSWVTKASFATIIL